MTEPKGRIRVCAADDIKPGEILGVEISGLPKLAIYRVGEEFYCTQDLCTHGAASLSDEGDLSEYVIECTWHDGKFDIRTGKPCALPCTEALRTFPASVDAGEVFIVVE